MVTQRVELAGQRPAAGRQPARGLLGILAEHRNPPGAGGEHRVVEAGDLLRAEQDQQRLQGHRGEGGHRHRVTDAVQAGGDHDDAAGEPPGGPPEIGRVYRGHAPARRGHRPARRDSANVSTTPAPALAAPPYRYHLPAVVSVTITLPAAVGMVSTNEARNQPNAGTRAPMGEPMPRPASRQVTKITTQNASAATGTGPTVWLNWQQPISPSITPSRHSAASAPPAAAESGRPGGAGRAGSGVLTTQSRLYGVTGRRRDPARARAGRRRDRAGRPGACSTRGHQSAGRPGRTGRRRGPPPRSGWRATGARRPSRPAGRCRRSRW